MSAINDAMARLAEQDEREAREADWEATQRAAADHTPPPPIPGQPSLDLTARSDDTLVPVLAETVEIPSTVVAEHVQRAFEESELQRRADERAWREEQEAKREARLYQKMIDQRKKEQLLIEHFGPAPKPDNYW